VITTGIAKNRSKRKQERLGRGVAKLPEDGGGEERRGAARKNLHVPWRLGYTGGDRRREAREVGFLKFWSRSVVSCPVAHPPHDGPQGHAGQQLVTPPSSEELSHTQFLAHNLSSCSLHELTISIKN
jgi:hypothetical protein